MKSKIIKGIPKLKKGKKVYLIGKMQTITYQTIKGNYYKHEFKKPFPFIVTDSENLFIVKNNKKMRFNPNQGIIN